MLGAVENIHGRKGRGVREESVSEQGTCKVNREIPVRVRVRVHVRVGLSGSRELKLSSFPSITLPYLRSDVA